MTAGVGAAAVVATAVVATVSPAALPDEIDRSFWLAHRGAFEWSERRKVLVYRPELAPEGAEEPQDPGKASRIPPPAPDPSALEGFLGQRRIVENLSLAIRAAQFRRELPPPVLLSGPPGLGKTTLAALISRALGSRLHRAQGPSLIDLGALIGILPDLGQGDILFIDEIHRVPAGIAECLYQALDEGALSIPVLDGSRTKLVKIRVEPFLLVAATTEEDMLPPPLRSRFGIRERLDLYPMEDLERLAVSAAPRLGIDVTPEGARRLARGARGTPRILLGLLGRARDLAQLETSAITADVARRALAGQGIDEDGLGETDRKILRILVDRGRPVGLRSLSDLLDEKPQTVAEIYEPHLFRDGWLVRTRWGRAATEKARRKLLPAGSALEDAGAASPGLAHAIAV